jgi:ribonucleoside-triphosphate reductase
MYFKIGWESEFSDLMMHLFSKYGRNMFTADGIGDQMDLDKFAKSFFKGAGPVSEFSVDANANVASKSVIEWNFEFAKPLSRYNSYYLLWKEIKKGFGLATANKIIEEQLCGGIYINDFTDVGRPYCFNYSTYDIALSGLSMSSRMRIQPPKSLVSFIRQVEQFTVYAANSTLGATGLADFLIVASLYYRKILKTGFDGHVRIYEPLLYLKEQLTSFIYTINWEFRGNQSPFTNVSVYDRLFLDRMCEDYSLDDIKASADYVEALQMIFLEAMNEELTRSPLTFPVVTACFATDDDNKIIDTEFKKNIASMNLQFGFINMYMGKTSTLSSCCRLRSNTDNPYFNSFGAGSTKIGSLGVVSLNLPRLAVKASRINGFESEVFYKLLEEKVAEIAIINECKRRIIRKRIELGAMPLYDLGHMDLNKQYSTVGFTGLNEAVEIAGLSILTHEGQDLAAGILMHINNCNDVWEKEFKAPHNMEQVPAESSAVKLAKKDKMLGFNDKYHLYSNQFIPLTVPANMLTRLELQGMFDGLCSGGAICHINVGEKIKSVDTMVKLMDYAAKCGVVYWAVNYAIKRCVNGHVWIDGDNCPVCGKSVKEVTTRVVGFFTNVAHWNPERKTYDWPNRQFYAT